MRDIRKTQTVFFYGLFMDPDILRSKGLAPDNFRIVSVNGYGLRIGEKASLEKSKSELVYGSVMDLDRSELEQLYSEAGVSGYKPIQVTATDLEGNNFGARSYVLPMNQMNGKNSDYAEALLNVAKKLGLPESHSRVIESWV